MAQRENATIIVGMDLSPQSLVALEEAVPIARARGAKIVMVHATPIAYPSSEYEWTSQAMASHYREIADAELAQLHRTLGEIEDRHRGQGVDISLSLITADAEHGIAKVADEFAAQLIVVGSHGRSGFDRYVLGSVSERVLRFTKRDVLVARTAHPRGRYQRLLVPTDFSEAANRSLEVARDLAAKDATITLLHCCDIPPAMAGYYTGDILSNVDAHAVARAEALAAPVRDAGIEVRVMTFRGRPAQAIGDVAKDYDIVVMGSHGRRGLRRYILGSVAEKTIRRALCSVYVVRAADKENDA